MRFAECVSRRPARGLVARWVRVVPTSGSGVVSARSGSSDAHYGRAPGYGMAMDVMMMDVANARTSGATSANSAVSGAGASKREGVSRNHRNARDADYDGCE